MDDITSSDYWYHWHYKINQAELVPLETEAVKRMHLAKLELGAAEEVLAQLRLRIAWGTLYNAGVRNGGRVVIDYSDGPIEAIFDGVERRLSNQICVRHITKRGKPEKRLRCVSYTMAEHIHPKPSTSAE